VKQNDEFPDPAQRSVRVARVDAGHGRREDTDSVAVE
jgi:hypothetical protein